MSDNGSNIKQLQDELKNWKDLYESLKKALLIKEREIGRLKGELTNVETQRDSIEKQYFLNKSLMQQMSQAASDKEEGLIEIINKQKEKLAELGFDGNFS